MGIAITYKGALADLTRLDSLIADVCLYCQQAGWEFAVVSEKLSGLVNMRADAFTGPQNEKPVKSKPWPKEETFHIGPIKLRIDPKNPNRIDETWRGVIAHPPGTESVLVTFDAEGRLCRYLDLPCDELPEPLNKEKIYLFVPLFCKTTGEVEQHIYICLLLKMIQERYIPDLEVSDETGYYESGDVRKLQREHSTMAGLVGMFRKPELLKGLLKVAGVPEKDLEGARVIEQEGPKVAAKKATIH